MKPIRRHLNYANIVATLALLFAMSGGALAAKHYLVNSTKQINPKVLRALHGRRGTRGAVGIAGAKGLAGTNGQAGRAGAQGPQGPAGPEGGFSETLPSGKTVRGAYSLKTIDHQAGISAISFGTTLPSEATVHYIEIGASVPSACAGGTVALPKAAPGNLCLFEAFHVGAPPFVSNPENEEDPKSGLTGAALFIVELSGSDSAAQGTWAVTAP